MNTSKDTCAGTGGPATSEKVRRAQVVFVAAGILAVLLLVVLLGSVVGLLTEPAVVHGVVAVVSAAGLAVAGWVCVRQYRVLGAHRRRHAVERESFAAVDRAVDVAVEAASGPGRDQAVAALCALPLGEVLDELLLRVRDVVIDEDLAAVMAACRPPIPAGWVGLVETATERGLVELRAALPQGPHRDVVAGLVEVLVALEDARDRLR